MFWMLHICPCSLTELSDTAARRALSVGEILHYK